MGFVNDTVTSEEFSRKTPLEKAQAVPELFIGAMKENPSLQEAMAAADTAGRQKLYDGFRLELVKRYPQPFTVQGNMQYQTKGSEGLVYMDQDVPVPIGNVETEKFLAEFQNPDGEKRKRYYSIRESLDDESRAQLDNLMLSRTGKYYTGIGFPGELVETREPGQRSGNYYKKLDPYHYPILIPNAIRTIGAVGGATIGGALGIESGPGAVASSSLGGMAGAAAVEPIAQTLEKKLSGRKEYSFGEGALNTAFGGIPLAPIKGGGGALKTAFRLGVRSAEGAAQGAGYSILNQKLMSDKPIDWNEVKTAGLLGAGLGAAFEGIPAAYRKTFSGKTAQEIQAELPAAIRNAEKAADREALTEFQKHIDNALNIGSEVKSAQEAAETIEPALAAEERVRQSKAGGEALKDQLASDEVLSAAKASDAERRATDFRKARAEELQDDIRGRQLGGDESIQLDSSNRLGVEPTEGLPAEGRAVESRFSDEVNARSDAENDALYDHIPDSRGGRVFNSNIAQELSPDYVTNRRSNNEPTLGVARAYVRDRFVRELQRIKDAGDADKAVVLFTGGGQGSGKSSFIEDQIIRGKNRGLDVLVFDGTLQDKAASEKLIRDAAGSGARVEVAYIHNPVENAMRRNRERGMELGGTNREVSPENLGKGHFNAQKNFIELAESPELRKAGVKFRVRDNSADGGSPSKIDNGVDFLKREDVRYADEQSTVARAREAYDRSNRPESNAGAAEAVDVSAMAPEGGRLAGERGPGGIDSDIGSEVHRPEPGTPESLVGEPELSPQAQRALDEDVTQGIGGPGNRRAGFISPEAMGGIGSASAGGVGGFYAGYESAPEGASEQKKLVRGIVGGLAGAALGTGGYAAGRRFLARNMAAKTPPASMAAPKMVTLPDGTTRPTKTLADVDRILTPKGEPSFWEKLPRLPAKAHTMLVSKYTPLQKLEQAVYEGAGKKTPSHHLARKFELLAGASGQGMQDVREFEKAILPKIKGNEQDFDRLLVAKRNGSRLSEVQRIKEQQAAISAIPEANRTDAERAIMGLDADRMRVSDWNLDDVDNVLSEMESRLGKKRFDELDAAALEMQQHMDANLIRQVESGRISQEAYDAIKNSNDFYAPFRVLDKVAETEMHGGGNSADTRKQIVNAISGIDDPDFRLDSPTKASVENLFAGRILAEKNMRMRQLADLAKLDPDGKYVRVIKDWQRPRNGYETVNFFENGSPMRLEVDADVASAVKGMNDAQANTLMHFLLRKAATPFKAGATAANVGFQGVNLAFADQPRLAIMSKYGLGRGSAMDTIRYPLDFVHSLYTSMGGAVGRNPNELYRKFYQSGAAGSTIQEALTPGVFKPKTAPVRGAMRALETVADFSKAIEETTKIMGFKRGMRIEGIEELAKKNPAAAKAKLDEVVTEIRNFSGSPDFARHGSIMPDANLLFMFMNARIQGNHEDFMRLAARRGGMKEAGISAAKLGALIGVPATTLWLVNNKPENEADYKARPDWERDNYFLIPRYEDGQPKYITADNGDKVRDYYRIPKREIIQHFGNTVEKSLDFLKSEDPEALKEWATGFLENVAPVNLQGKDFGERAQSVISSMNPAVRAPFEIATGYDTFRKRPILSRKEQARSPELQYGKTTNPAFIKAAQAMPEAAPDFMRSPKRLQHATQAFTAGLITQAIPDKPQNGRGITSTLPFTSRFYSAPYTKQEENKRLAEAERHQADERFKQQQRDEDVFNRMKSSKSRREAGTILREHAQKDPDAVDRIMQIVKDDKAGITYEDRRVKQLGVKNGERARYIIDTMDAIKDQAKKREYVRSLITKGILTDDVLDQITAIRKAKK